ncbi:MAG: outer membrane beta-barrel protein [Bacteroides sp.]|nr:outer membrane beta-barrel protein [Bacteroides sp.]MCM1412974.1 outer membrane beta-barrel protein [Bacteroides sp.]MCM1471680.1 outer membrane beta-barrel protein [Bacteroides sp.]
MENPFHKLSLLLLIMVLTPAIALASVVKGKVIDDSGEGLPQATLRLLSPADSSFVKGIKSNSSGAFSFSDVKAGKYILEASYLGYNSKFTNINVTGSTLTVPEITLTESSIMLGEVSVVGVATQVKVSEDTVEFNAGSYKTQPNAVVEDLLKRLPGVEVGTDGTITANGQTVSKILIDGKEFFSDDPKVASKNLPVDMVEKLQVVNRKSDLARLTGVDDGEDETVINLTVKSGMKNGYFGTVEAGYGTDSRYMGTFNVNKFWNDNQITLLGNFNNINELGFTDSNGNRFRRFGGNNGINTSQAFGINFNVGNKEIFRLGGDVMYSHSDRDTRQRQDRQYLFSDSTSYAFTTKNTRDKGHNFRGDFRLQWKPDSFNTLEFRPNFSYNVNDSYSLDSTLNRAGDPMQSLVSRTFNESNSDGHSFEFGANAIYSHNFRNHPGRAFSIQLRYNHSNVRENETSYSLNRFFNFADSTDLYDQLTDMHTWSDMAQARVTWTEPLGDVKKGNFLTFAYRIQYRWNNTDKLVYDHPLLPPGADGLPIIDYSQTILSDSLSNQFRNDYFNQNIRLGYRHVSSSHNLDIGLSLVPQSSSSKNLSNPEKTIATRWVWNVAPFLNYRLKMGKNRSLNINYRGRSSQPSMTQLQPVADYSDPMRIVIGNPNLDPSFTHYLRMRFQDFNAEHQRSIMMMADFDMTQNSIVSRTSFDRETGAQTTTYENVNGVWSGRVMAMFSQPLRNKAWQVSAHSFLMYNQRVGFNNGDRNRSGSLMWNFMPSIAWRPDNLEFEFRPRYSLQYTTNSLKSAGNMTVHNYGGTFSAYYYTPIGIILNTDLTYTATSGYSQGYDKNEWMWNASVSYQFLRSKSLTLSVKAYDLLQQRSNISRSVTANYIDDINYNGLTRYFMVTVSYKFNTFGKGNEPVDRNAWHGRGGPGGMGGRPHR